MFVILFKLFFYSMTGNSVIPCYCSLWSVASYLHCLLFSQISFSFWKYPGWHLHVFSEQMAFESPLRVQLLVPVHVEPRTEKQIGVHCMTVLFSTNTWCKYISLSLYIYIYFSQYDSVHLRVFLLLILMKIYFATMLSFTTILFNLCQRNLAKRMAFLSHSEMSYINQNLLFWQSFWVVFW